MARTLRARCREALLRRPARALYTIARELVDSGFDLAIASSGAAARAVIDTSRGRMPVVILFVSEPVQAGLAQSLAHPGGPVTGIYNVTDELTPERIELLKAALPGATRVAFARCPACALGAGTPAAEVAARIEEEAAATRRIGITLLTLEVNSVADFDAARTRLRNDRPDALLIGATQVNVALRDEWIALADGLRLPNMTRSSWRARQRSVDPASALGSAAVLASYRITQLNDAALLTSPLPL